MGKKNTKMEQTTVNQTNVAMHIHENSPYVLTIPREVERKIRYHLNRFNGREWSGYLFYTYEGSFKENNIHFIAKNFVFLDLGDGATTMFKESPKVLSFAIDNDLLDCKEGLIHSHHNMAAFFSGTDNAAIKQEAMNVNHFLSLVVNNAGTYVARVTLRRRVNKKIHQEVVSECWYNTFEDTAVHIESHKEEPVDITQEETEIEVFPLIIEIEKDNSFDTSKWENDISEVISTKRTYTPPTNFGSYKTAFPITSLKDTPEVRIPKEKKVNENTLASKSASSQLAIQFDDLDSKDRMEIIDVVHKLYNEADIKLLTLRIVACCPFLGASKISSTPQFAAQLPEFVKSVFEEEMNYHNIIETLIESLMLNFVDNIPDNKITLNNPEIDLDAIQSVIAMDVQERLCHIPQNKYISYISAVLDAYIV